MPRLRSARAFTLVELMVVLGVITTLSAFLLPAVQSAREAGRRASCQNNLRQVGLALQNYESQNRQFPVGARCQRYWPSGLPTIGVSWWVEILPFLERTSLAERLDVTGPYCGWVTLHPRNGNLIDGVSIGPIQCPASPFQPFALPAGTYRAQIPSYVGISGAANGDGFNENDTSASSFGEFSSGGILFANSSISLQRITDGTSNTLIVGEISDVCFDKNGQLLTNDSSYSNGWLSGTAGIGTPSKFSGEPTYNITTIRYTVGTREFGLPGVVSNGANNPLRSPHSRGAFSVFADGSVQFLRAETDLVILKRLATRDDGDVTDR
jgi:prepilin-type N-terminal cleavage/methylation domain-containing protein